MLSEKEKKKKHLLNTIKSTVNFNDEKRKIKDRIARFSLHLYSDDYVMIMHGIEMLSSYIDNEEAREELIKLYKRTSNEKIRKAILALHDGSLNLEYLKHEIKIAKIFQ
jgi:hypothetical protein